MSKPKRRLDIQKIRSEKKLTQKELSRITGYPQGFISKMERGKAATPQSFIDKIRDLFEITDIDKYVSLTMSLQEEAPSDPEAKPEVKKPRRSEDAGMSDKQMIQRLFKMLEKREARIDKLERELDQLHHELSAIRLEMLSKIE